MRYEKAFFVEGPGERMVLRALLETLAANGWPEGPVPDAWATEPLTLAMVARAVASRGASTRYLTRDTLEMLAKMLARHLEADAMPLLLALLDAAAAHPRGYDELRGVGESIALVAHHHPALRDVALARVDACIAASAEASPSIRGDLALTRERVARGARHFGSNV